PGDKPPQPPAATAAAHRRARAAGSVDNRGRLVRRYRRPNGTCVFERDRRTDLRGVRLACPAWRVYPAHAAVVADAVDRRGRLPGERTRGARAAGRSALGGRSPTRFLRP